MIYRWIMCVCIWVSWTQVYSAPGPDSTFLLLNQNSEVSIRIATAYQRARFLPDYHLCRLDLPIDDAMDLATFIDHLYTPLIDCLGDSLSSVDTLVLSKGIPLRVRDDQLGGISFSTSSLLSIAQSTYQDQPIWTAPLTEYGSCGPNVMCWRPYQASPWTISFCLETLLLSGWLGLVILQKGLKEKGIEILLRQGPVLKNGLRLTKSTLHLGQP